MTTALAMMLSGLLIAACTASDRVEKQDSSTDQPVSHTQNAPTAVAEASSSSEEGLASGEGEVESRGFRGQLFEPNKDVPLKLVPLITLTPNGAVACTKDRGNPQSTTGRDLDGYMWSDPAMTNTKCRNSCASRGYVFAGTQYGSYCFCGERYGQIGPATNCDMGCSGNGNEMCGGAWANSVSLSGAEPKIPPPPTNGSQCVVSGRGTLQHANPKVVGTYRYLEIQRWEVTGPPVANGTGYLLPVLWTTTGSGSLHEEDGIGGVTDIKWGISGAHRTALTQIGTYNHFIPSWKITRANVPPSTVLDSIVETQQQTINGVAQPVVINKSQATEVPYGDILTYDRNIGVQHDVRTLGIHKYGHRQPMWAIGRGQCESQITLGHP